MGKKLTEEEKRKIEEYARQHADPTRGRVYSVNVGDEIDDQGQVHYQTLYVEEKVMPKGWKP